MECPTSLIAKIHDTFCEGMPLAISSASVKTSEFDLVRGVLQGNTNSLFYWDQIGQCYCAKAGIYMPHLSLTSLNDILNHFLYAATCLRLVEHVVSKIEVSVRSSPTLRAFAGAVSAWLKMLRDIALKEEMKIVKSDSQNVPTLLGMTSSLSSLCTGAEFLLQIVREGIPQVLLDSIASIPASQVAAHILDQLYKRLHEVCLVQGGEEDAYRMLLYLFVASLLPYIECLDSWLYEGILDDPFNEMFFYENKSVSISDAAFWEKSYLLRSFSPQKSDPGFSSASHDRSFTDSEACPKFIRDFARSIVSAGKSLQLIRHAPANSDRTSFGQDGCETLASSENADNATGFGKVQQRHKITELTLSEIFCISISGLIAHGDHVYNYLFHENLRPMIVPSSQNMEMNMAFHDMYNSPANSGKIWIKFLGEALKDKKIGSRDDYGFNHLEDSSIAEDWIKEVRTAKSFHPQNPVLTVSKMFLDQNKHAWSSLNLSKHICLPSLNDEELCEALFSTKSALDAPIGGTNYTFGFQFTESGYFRSQDDIKVLETLFPFPTIIPAFEDNLCISEVLPFQKNSSLSSKFLRWIQGAEPRSTPLPVIVLQECLIVYVKKQVDYIGGCMLSKLLKEWRLMDELEVLRAIYLLGSGDLLHHFLTVIFSRLDRGESWDDEFELNMILQESITNSSDHMILSAPDSLVISIMNPSGLNGSDAHNSNNFVSTPRKIHEPSLGINGLDVLNFTYKVSWPLELIANTETIKKYNQVMCFLLKVRRAKYVLDKARRGIWKDKGNVASKSKRHWLVEQKLLHFIDAFHQYVMDRVYHSAWLELCDGMAAAHSLDEVIEVHDAYLLSIQRQCFVVPDKLWALIASRINTILGLALDFYNVQQTLSSGGAVSTIKARCEMEVDRIEKQFDDCIAFLLRVLSFKLNVGHFPHLADLVTRINYNYYYMSHTGNMINAPGSETIKLGKNFPTRTT
ncbi:LOW QUALITY PROTEIN: hypothetical protein V2J09_023886 [Rumex salicifolius]